MPEPGWILLLYSLPSGEGSFRVGLWRKLKKSGAIPFGTSAYLLPNRPDRIECFQWLAQQVNDAGGEGSLAYLTHLEGLSRDQIEDRFNAARNLDYDALVAPLEQWIEQERARTQGEASTEIERIRQQFHEIRSIDFFAAPSGKRIEFLLKAAASLRSGELRETQAKPLSAEDYRGKTWLTRPHPGIDRIGSAWLVLRRLDPGAKFVFTDDLAAFPEAITFDRSGGDFTHCGEDCTFETLLKRFGLKEPALQRIAERIHDADLGDGRFQTIEAFGLDCQFRGWARLGVPDNEILERGLLSFDGLFAELSATP